MSIAPGTRLTHFELISLLGAGGMGEVYKARDTRLDRIVAIKVLPAHLADKPELRERFEREARTIASLNHPHICTLHDVGHHDGTDFLVMEYLEGETLATKLLKGPLPLEQVLQYAIEISDALDKAHRKGVTHRDIKPGNVMLTKSGTKLLDFGLAKLKQAAAPASLPESQMPTLSKNPTVEGTLLGTLQYMAPEQVEGKIDEIDGRTDIFAFGALVYEMATGKKAFEGKTQASLIAKILEVHPPSMSSIQPVTPPALDRVVKKCLAKEPERRWQAASDVCDELKWIAEGGSPAGIPTPARGAAAQRQRPFGWIAAVAVLLLALAAVSFVHFREAPSATAAEVDLDITTPPTTDPVSLAISPDGRRVVFAATSEGHSQLWIRSLDGIAPQPLAGTDDATLPFWSPDSRSIGFFAQNKLKRIDIAGGSVQTLADAQVGRGGTWNRDGTILFAPTAVSPIYQIAATGGKPAELTHLEKPAQTDHRSPQFLPDGRHFLYYARGTPEGRGVYVGQLDGSHSPRLVDADAAAVYAASGHLLFVRQGTLFAERFDVDRLALVGDQFPVAQQIIVNGGTSLAALSTSQAGPIIYRAGTTEQQLVWTDRFGKAVESMGDADSVLSAPSLSPDGRRVAVGQNVGGNWDVWLIDIARGVRTRLTSDPALDQYPVWSPDGNRIVFYSARNGKQGLYTKSLTGAGQEDLLLETPYGAAPTDWSSDGRFLLYSDQRPATGIHLWVLPMSGERKPIPFAQSTFNERESQFSPDGKWIAYQSDGSGRSEIYVQPFPGPGEKTQVSTMGGAQVRWRADGKEMFYIAPDGRLMAVPMQVSPNGRTIDVGRPVPLFSTHIGGALQATVTAQYAVARDGQHFLMNTAPDATPPIRVILNWAAGVKK